MSVIILLMSNAVFADYVRTETLAKIVGTLNSSNQTYENDFLLQNEVKNSTIPKRYMNGMYGIGSQDYLINKRVHFLDLESFVNNELEWFNFDSNSTSLGCQETDYLNQDVVNKIGLIVQISHC